jgi:signal transduction histidine kinase
MLRRSLTAKILLAVGLTVAAVIAIYTYFVIRIQSAWWSERTQAQTVIAATMVREYLEGVMLSEHHEEVGHFLRELKKSDEILRGRVIDISGKIIFSTETQEVRQAHYRTPEGLFTEKRTLQGIRTEGRQRLAVTMAPVANLPSCGRCHDPKQPVLGAIVLEKSMAAAETNIAGNRNLLIAYGAIIFVLVGAVLWLLIIRLISQPVSSVVEQMQHVQAGDLTARAEARRQDEIGELERGFNVMVESLDTAKRELHESHEKQIQQASKLASIGELASGIAHEIRNPLAGIGAAVSVLADNSTGNEQYAEVAGEIKQQVNRLNTTLRELLDFARQREPEITPCHVCDLIRPMLALIRPDAQKQHIEIVERCSPDLPMICADTQQVQQAVLNGLLNAVQAMPEGGTLTVSAEPAAKTLIPEHDRVVRICIRDTGSGIPPEHLLKIFSPFFTTKHRGTGLGLAITRSIVEKHHGTIAVDSVVGAGTTLTMEFVACLEGECGEHRKTDHG